MTVLIIRRIIQAIIVALCMTVIVFIGVYVIGSPIRTLISPDADQQELERVIKLFGYDQPLWRQYIIFMSDLLTGKFPNSYVYNESALVVTLQRLPATLELAIAAILVALLIGIPLGLYAGLRPHSPFAKLTMVASILGFSVPGFWLALTLIMLFAVTLGWLPSGGRGDTAALFGIQWSFLTLDGLRHMILPATALSISRVALIIRLIRAGVSEILPQDFIRYARAKGLRNGRVLGVHILKNIMIPVVTVVGVDFGSLIGASVVAENVFAWPGIGKLILDSINGLDRPVIVAYLMLIVVVFVAVNLVVDLTYAILDPRVRLVTGRET